LTTNLWTRENRTQKKKKKIKKTTSCKQCGCFKEIKKKEQQKKQRCLKKDKKSKQQIETKKNIQRYARQIFKRKKRVILCKKAKKINSVWDQKKKTENKVK
jgi:uncharacterized paraquat-inducible protein A